MHEAFIVALLLRAILASLIHVQWLQGAEPPRMTGEPPLVEKSFTTARITGNMGAGQQTARRLAK
jgi:hypothetical protein